MLVDSEQREERRPVELLSISEAAARLGVHQNTLRRWANEGLVKSIRPPKQGGHRRFTAAEIERLGSEMGLEEQEGTAAA